ncbi:MAG: hypothetical protein WD871_01680 [Xanthobacteraceae bacterium]
MARPRKTATSTATPKRRLPELKTGDFVLMGGTRASYPSGWFLGKVLWSDRRDVLIERDQSCGGRVWREVYSILEVRAVGTIEQLVKVQNEAFKATLDLVREVHAAEYVLGRARDAVHAKVDELAERQPLIFPADFAAIDGANAQAREAAGAVTPRLPFEFDAAKELAAEGSDGAVAKEAAR